MNLLGAGHSNLSVKAYLSIKTAAYIVFQHRASLEIIVIYFFMKSDLEEAEQFGDYCGSVIVDNGKCSFGLCSH